MKPLGRNLMTWLTVGLMGIVLVSSNLAVVYWLLAVPFQLFTGATTLLIIVDVEISIITVHGIRNLRF